MEINLAISTIIIIVHQTSWHSFTAPYCLISGIAYMNHKIPELSAPSVMGNWEKVAIGLICNSGFIFHLRYAIMHIDKKKKYFQKNSHFCNVSFHFNGGNFVDIEMDAMHRWPIFLLLKSWFILVHVLFYSWYII